MRKAEDAGAGAEQQVRLHMCDLHEVLSVLLSPTCMSCYSPQIDCVLTLS